MGSFLICWKCSISDISAIIRPRTPSQQKEIDENAYELKPRAAVLFNDSLSKEGFVPGVDPTNFIEQDRKLGYQKPRMWFPTPMMALAKDGLETATAKSSGPSQIVEEYLRMRALATYVGDAVVPLSGNLSKYLPSTSILDPVTLANGKTAPIDALRYKNAVREVMDMWTPILSAHRPPNGKRPQFSYLRSQEDPPPPPVKERKVHEEYVSFEDDDDDDEGGPYHDSRSQRLSQKMKYLSRDQIMDDLKERKEKLHSSISSISNRINTIMDKAYQRFQTRYLVVLEGNQADARKKLMNMTRIFLHHKRRNLLILAFGLLKVPMVEAALKSRTPQYQRIAACNLLLGWLKRARRKNFQRWMARWVYITSCIVFAERMKAAATIQTLIRRNRDRKKFMLMHKTKPYLGPLSDIRLGPYRPNVRYKIPRPIRTERRMYWLAATLIQTCFRCWFESKDYFLKKRRIILLQSICRMWPKYCHYRRLKRATIRCQSWARRTLWRGHYLKLKVASIVVQKYVRRYLCILKKLAIFQAIWEDIEEEKAAVIKIQRRLRIHRAKRKHRGKRMYKRMIQWGALVIQRNWYRKKGAFHTFFLMCALRERESQDIALEKLATKMGRYQCARRIQRLYRQRFWDRVISNVIRVQCWYRGRLGFRNAERLRKQRWASRKLHHWVKGLLRRRHVMARRIQAWWWRQKKRRLLKHLWLRQRQRDQRQRYAFAERRHHAALRIQAIVKGVWDRRWVKRTRAALLIQKNWRFLHGLKKWKRMKKDHIMKGVQRAVNGFIDKAMKLRVTAIVRYHIGLVIKVQALMRGFIVRAIVRRSRQYAAKLAPAVITIQRFWRKSGMLLQAVEELLARKRIEANPFKFCTCVHDILVTVRRELKSVYHVRDPRIGMRISDFLYRLGYYEYLELFPKRDFKFVTELQTLTMDKLTELYIMAQNRKRANAKDGGVVSNNNARRKNNGGGGGGGGGNGNGGNGAVDFDDDNGAKKRKIPVQDLQAILNVVTIPLFPKKRKDYAALCTIMSFPEYCKPQEAIESIRSFFLKKFGRHLQARATNVATEIVENAFYDYNTFRSFVQPVTKAQIMRALTEAPESAAVLSTLESIRQVPPASVNGPSQVDEWLKFDTDRMKQALAVVQMAYDRAFDLLPRGSIAGRLEKAVGKGAAFKRKADYLKKKAEQTLRLQRLKAAKQQQGKGKFTAAAAAALEEAGVAADLSAADGAQKKGFTDETLVRRWTPSDCVELPYHGADKYLDLEYFASSTRLYLDVLDQYHGLTLGIQSLKNAWHNKAMRRAVQAEKRRTFLAEVTTQYITEQQTNKVRDIWDKLRRREVAQKIYNNLIMAARSRKFEAEAMLAYIPRYHIQTYYDDPSGYAYYVDEHGEATYEMPIYTFGQHLAVKRIQAIARRHIERSWQRRLAKEEEERQRIVAMEEAMLREQREALKACVVELRSMFDQQAAASSSSLSKSPVTQLLSFIRPSSDAHADTKKRGGGGKKDTKHPHPTAAAKKSLEDELEDTLPWNYRFTSSPTLIPGMWALYFPPKPGIVAASQSHNQHGHRLTGYGTTSHGHGQGHGHGHGHGHGNATSSSLTMDNFLLKRKQWFEQLAYEIVVVFRIRLKEGLCDIRNFKGIITKDVPVKRLRHLPYGVGFKVECRYRHRKLFYRAQIHCVHDLATVEPVFDVTYEDNEKEYGLGRDAIRPNAAYLTEWLIERERLLKELFLVRRRHEHYTALRKDRMINSSSDNPPGDVVTGDDTAKEATTKQRRGNSDGNKKAASTDKTKATKANTKEKKKTKKTTATAAGEGNIDGGEAAVDDLDNLSTASPALSKKQEKLLLAFYADHHRDEEAAAQAEAEAVAGRTMGLISKAMQRRHPSLLHLLDPLGPIMIKVNLRVTRRALHMGWQIISSPNSAEPVYYHPERDEQRDHAQAPFYSAAEINMVQRIQARWHLHKATMHIRRYVHTLAVPDYVQQLIYRASRMAYVGYKWEGLTCIQLLTRAGYWEIAEMIRDYYRDMRKSLWTLTIEDIATKRPEEFDRLGILQAQHIRDLKEFQAWWKKTLPYERDNKLALINYYASPEDPRSLSQCIQESSTLLFKKFLKGIKTSSTKTKKAVDTLLNETHFPLTHAQIDWYLKKYADHPDQAREAILELADRHTCSTQAEERRVYEVYRHGCMRVAAVFAVFKLKKWRHFIRHKLQQADDIVQLRNAAPTTMDGTPEAKAAWLLRRDVLQYVLDMYRAAFILQRHIKRYLKAKKFQALLVRRRQAIDAIQRTARRYFAYRLARFLRLQQASPWEQLWHHEYNTLYYYNYVTAQSTYVEPPTDVSYRPLVRHPVSAALMQAWPSLDEARRMYYTTGQSDPMLALTNGSTRVDGSAQALELSRSVVIPPNTRCHICDTRLGVKLCLDCLRHEAAPAEFYSAAQASSSTVTVTKPTNYCLPCYAKAHPADQEERNGPHRYVVVATTGGHGNNGGNTTMPLLTMNGEPSTTTGGDGQSLNSDGPDAAPYLHCCICNAPATRKCQGLYSDAYVDLLCERLKKATLADWRQVVMDCTLSPASTTAVVAANATNRGTDATVSPAASPSRKRSPHQRNKPSSPTASSEFEPGYVSQSRSLLLLTNGEDADDGDGFDGLGGGGGGGSSRSMKLTAEDNEDLAALVHDDRGTGGADKTRLITLIEEVLAETGDDSLLDSVAVRGEASPTGAAPSLTSLFSSTVMAAAMDASSTSKVHSTAAETLKYSALSPLQLQSIRSLFTKLRAECDECYCRDCYQQVHGHGKRQLHIWKGFQAKVHVCTVCQSSPVDNQCLDCGVEYCEPCFKVFHTKGQKRKHKHTRCREEIRNKKQEVYCPLCHYRVGHQCPRGAPCTMKLCDECTEFRHLRTLSCGVTKQEYQAKRMERYERQQQRLAELQRQEDKAREDAEIAAGIRDPRTRQRIGASAASSSAGVMASGRGSGGSRARSPTLAQAAPSSRSPSPSRGGSGAGTASGRVSRSPSSPPRSASNQPPPPPPCTICGEDADKICVECGDYYCSRTWMGNPGCFVQVHSRGNRASHATEPLSKAKLVLFQRQMQRQQQQKAVSAAGPMG
eukprot:gene10304-7320_t